MATIQTSIAMNDNLSACLYNIVNALNQTVTAFQDVQGVASNDMDAGAFNGIKEGIYAASAAAQTFQNQLDSIKPKAVAIEWESPQNIEIFGGKEVERYKQEIQSTNTMLERLQQAQQQIGQQAAAINILPPAAASDLDSMNTRIQALHSQMVKMQSARLQVVGVERANAEMESMRQRLNQALLSQNNLNRALNKMDVSAASAAYSQLNAVVVSLEGNIRDNLAQQQKFNRELNNGSKNAGGLRNKIMGMAAAYLSVQGVAKVLNLSDTMASNTARLGLIVDDGGSVDELQDKIFLSAQRSRGDYLAVSETVSKLGLMAGDAFTSNDEIIAFTEQMNKNFVIGGQSIQDQESAMRQLTQAMTSGRLQGEEYVSVIENAPLLADAIEQHMTEAGFEGTMKDWSEKGLLTSSVIKAAMFSTVDETNERFDKIPKTFSQIATGLKNDAVMAFQPLLLKLNEIANSPGFQIFADNAVNAIVGVAGVVTYIFDMAMAAAEFVSDNWSIIAPIVYGAAAALAVYYGWQLAANGVELISKGLHIAGAAASMIYAAATGTLTAAKTAEIAAQWGLNAALYACPIVWIILLIIALIAIIYLVVAAINKFAGTSISATGIIFGAFSWLGSVIMNIFMSLLEQAFGVINSLVNPFVEFANFLANLFNNPVSSIIYLFQGMADNVLGILEKIASSLDFVFGTNMAEAVAGWRSGLKGLADKAVERFAPEENYEKVYQNLDFSVEKTLGLERKDNTDAFNKGYEEGKNFDETISNFDMASLFGSNIPTDNGIQSGFDPSNIASDVADINSNTSNLADASEEDLKYLRDIAERDTINRFTTAEINFEMGGVHNNVNSTMDLDGITDYIGDSMLERLEIVAEGVHP